MCVYDEAGATDRFVGGVKMLSLAFVAFVGMAVPSYATPVISDLKVTPIAPWGLAIDYTVSGATANDATRPIEVSMTVSDDAFVAKNLSGETGCTDGAHRVYWNMAHDGISARDVADAVVTVKYKIGEGAQYCVVNLIGGSTADSYSVSYLATEPSGGFNTDEYKTTKLVLKRVEAGTFIMGEYQSDETHRVTLTKPFYMGLFEVTQKQWELVMGSNPCATASKGTGDAYPVYRVAYDKIRGSSDAEKWIGEGSVDSASFLGKLRDKTGTDFDLPTEAQWEYTCRAGSAEASDEDGHYMWYTENSGLKTHEVGTRLSNDWGFYDMLGNMSELCLDWTTGALSYGVDPMGSPTGWLRVLRGGSCLNNGAGAIRPIVISWDRQQLATMVLAASGLPGLFRLARRRLSRRVQTRYRRRSRSRI